MGALFNSRKLLMGCMQGPPGPAGMKLDSVEQTGQDANGGYIYTMKFSDGSTAQFVVPKAEGESLEGLATIEALTKGALVPAKSKSAEAAEKATRDAAGNNIPDTYATKAALQETAGQVAALGERFTAFEENGGGGAVDTYSKDQIDAMFDEIDAMFADLKYTLISISNFAVSPSSAEIGSTVNTVTLTWMRNKAATAQTINDEEIDATVLSKVLTGLSIKEAQTWTIKATDEKGNTSTKSAGITFLNGVYYGAAAEPSNYNSTFVKSLTQELASSHKSFSATAGAGQYLFYCYPSSRRAPTFTVGVLPGGFSKVATINFTNASGYAESYDIYKSDNANLGDTSVVVQ